MAALGYEFLRQSLALSAFIPDRPALLKPVTRIEQTDTFLAIPKHVAPATDDPIVHVLFALKHEGTNLQILAEALPKINPASLIAELRRAPTGNYTRTACYLWEQFTGKQLTDLPEIAGPTVEVFDSARYITGAARRNMRWRVAFNGLGSIHYCPTVKRTPVLQGAIKSDVLGRANAFIGGLGKGMMDRALAWAYLHETESSFAIEHETPSENKSRMFVTLLHQAHHHRLLSEDYLVELQNSILTNPYDRATGFRTQQNWLSGSMRGAAGVTYLPPPPEMVPDLMQELIDFANHAPRHIDPVVAASITSFGFVFIHPFMDGNGRLSRFLFHHALCQSGQLEKGILLPVSVAMKRNEEDYLSVLQQYSQQARDRWTVRWIDGDQYDTRLTGDPGMYCYWDATRCVEFGYRMAEQALEVELRDETIFLARYDKIVKAVEERFDVRGSDLATLVLCCLDNNDTLSIRRREQFDGRTPEGIFNFIEQCARETRPQQENTVAGSVGDPSEPPVPDRGPSLGR
ncbi:MAG: Fic family protein [Sulfuricellaceae bacterium]|nr:Fic family protein [Sulfuricellaceae bacterium]